MVFPRNAISADSKKSNHKALIAHLRVVFLRLGQKLISALCDHFPKRSEFFAFFNLVKIKPISHCKYHRDVFPVP
jgi:hypothetical protein